MEESLTNHSESVLIIDDDPIVEDRIVAVLTSAGYKVDITSSYASAKAFLQSFEPDLVILDLDVPGLDSIRLVKTLIDQKPGTPIIVLTHEGIEELTVAALKLDVTDYILKPLRDEVVLFSVHSSLERARLERENRAYRDELEKTNRELQSRLHEIEVDAEAGYRVQQGMLPQSPFKLFNYNFEHKMIPAVYLAGDFVDYHQVSRDKAVFFLIDVTGHGAASAFITVFVKQLALRSRMHFKKDHHRQVKSAAWMTGWINRTLIDAGIDRHMTIFLGVLDRESNVLNYAYGGQFPQAIYSSKGETRYLEGRGLPVGLTADAHFEDHHIELEEDFGLTLFSDGILEVLPVEGLPNKEAYLLEVVKGSDNNIAKMTKCLQLDSLDYPPDDISVMTISRYSDGEE